jgi:hypothetical protein
VARDKEKARKYQREWRRARAGELNHARRVRWRGDAEFRKAEAERQRKRRANPRARLEDSERLSRRHAKAARGNARRVRRKGLAGRSIISLAELRRPRYIVIDQQGRRAREFWPLDDQAARWLACHAEASEGRAAHVDTKDTPVSTIRWTPAPRTRTTPLAIDTGPRPDPTAGINPVE